MSSTREVRELQLSSSQLIILFLAILILGVFIFLLGVSVGKKQALLTQETTLARKPVSTALKKPGPVVPKVTESSPIEKEISSHAKQAGSSLPMSKPESTSVATEKPASSSGAKPTATQSTKPAVTPTEGSAPVKPKSGSAKTPASTPKVKSTTSPTRTTTTPTTKTSVPVKGQYYIQLAAFDERSAAEAYAADIKTAGFPTLILSPLATDKTPWYRVRVGGYATKEDAEKAVYQLKAAVPGKKLEYWITRE